MMKLIQEDNLEDKICPDVEKERKIAEEVSQKIEKGELKEDQVDGEILKKIKEANLSCEEWQNHYAFERIKDIINIEEAGPIFLPTTRSRRFLNLILDYVGCFVFALLVGVILGVSGWAFLVEGMNVYVLNFVIWMLYYGIFESIWAKSPAKFITRTRVITEDGMKPPLKTILIRTLGRFVPFEALSFLTPGRPRGWHDKWSKTIVIGETRREHRRNIKDIGDDGMQVEKNAMTRSDIYSHSVDKMFYCVKCGHKLEKNSKFCCKCGAKI